MSKKRCTKCKSLIEDKDIFCWKCGENVRVDKFLDKATGVVKKVPGLSVGILEEFTTLASQVDELDDVDIELHQLQAKYEKLKLQLKAASERRAKLITQRAKEKREVDELKEISWKSLIASIKRSKKEELEKEEAEYLDVMNRLAAAEDEVTSLDYELRSTHFQIGELLWIKRKKESLENVMSIILENVEDPESGRIEKEIEDLQRKKAPLTEEYSKIREVRGHFKKARDNLSKANEMLGVFKDKAWEGIWGDGPIIETLLFSKMAKVRKHVQDADRSIDYALDIYDDIPAFPEYMKQKSLFWDEFMEKFLKNLDASENIEFLSHLVLKALGEIDDSLIWIRQKGENLRGDYKIVISIINAKKKELLNHRCDLIKEKFDLQI